MIYRRHITAEEMKEDFDEEEEREAKIMKQNFDLYGIEMNDCIKDICESFNYKPIHEGEEPEILETKEKLKKTKLLFYSADIRIENLKKLDIIEK